MNNIYKKRVRDFILQHHDFLCDNLPPEGHGGAPRNGTAHCYWCIKHVFHVDNINEISDKDYQAVMDVLKLVVDNATNPNIVDLLPVRPHKQRVKSDLSSILHW